MTTNPSNEEPVTQRIRREMDKKDLVKFRRIGDQFDAYLKIIIPIVLSGAIVWVFSIRDIQKEHNIYITQMQASMLSLALEIKDLQSSKKDEANFEKIVDISFTEINKRLDKIELKLDQLRTPEEKAKGPIR